MPTKVRADIACQIAQIDRLKFNEVVASGAYPCPPQTTRGAPRMFSPVDVVTLMIFKLELDRRKPAHEAGRLACEFTTTWQRENQTSGFIYLVRFNNSVSHDASGAECDPHWMFLSEDELAECREEGFEMLQYEAVNVGFLLKLVNAEFSKLDEA